VWKEGGCFPIKTTSRKKKKKKKKKNVAVRQETFRSLLCPSLSSVPLSMRRVISKEKVNKGKVAPGHENERRSEK
jgi:hypothetical protein